MRKLLALTAASAFLFLAGCASERGMEIVTTTDTASAEPVEIVTPTPTVTAAPSPSATSGPLQLTAPPPVPEEQALRSEWYGVVGRSIQLEDLPYPNIADVLPMGQHICDEYRAGVPLEDIVAVEGLPAEENYVKMNTWLVHYTTMDGEDWGKPPEERPQFCAVLFPPT